MTTQPVTSGEIPAANWLADFTPFSLQHVISSGFFLCAIALTIFIGLKRRGTDEERKLRRLWGVIAIFTMAVDAVWWCMPSTFDIRKSLPLYVCDLAGWLAGMYMLTDLRVARVLLFYFGLFLSSQAFFIPVIGEGQGMATGRFWLFYVTHTHIVGVALYDLIVLRYRPTWRDCWSAIWMGVVYVSSMALLNYFIGRNANYGFMGPGNGEDQPAPIRFFGAYPLRILWIALAVSALFAGVTATWLFFLGRMQHPAPNVK